MTEPSPVEQVEHWRSELARVLNAAPDMPWPVLIEWAEEDELVAMKAATRVGRAKLIGIEQRLAAMEKLAAAWQKEAEHARKDCAVPADMADVAEMRIWDALERPLTMEEVTEHIKILRGVRHLAVHAIEVSSDTYKDAKKRVTALHAPVQHMGQTWCAECSVRRRTGPKTEEWVAFIPHPCPTIEALENTAQQTTDDAVAHVEQVCHDLAALEDKEATT